MSEYGNLIEQSFGTANPALPPVVGDIDANPDQAARALELAKATGAPASAIFGDLDEFERLNKAQYASAIVRGNSHIADFVASDPMVPKIANDDYGNLDSVSQKTSEMSLPMRVLRAPQALAEIMFPGDPFKRFTEGGPLGSWIKDSDLKNYPFASAVAAGLGTPIELILRGLGGAQDTAADAAANLAGAVGQERLGRDLGAMVQSAGLTGRTSMLQTPSEIVDSWFRARHFVENGREPLPTVLPEYDAFRAERNAKDVEALGDVVKDAQQSLVRERNPDLFRDFIARHTDAEIGIGADAITALYGEKRPSPDDGLLGWVPGIEEKLRLAQQAGDDVSIPLADWVAKVDPEVMKALVDDIRVRPGAITAREAQLAKEMEQGPTPPPLPEEVPQYRAASALEPLFSIGDRKLRINRIARDLGDERFPDELAAADGRDWNTLTPAQRAQYQAMSDKGRETAQNAKAFESFHDFDMLDEKGNSVGTINLSEQAGGKKLYVEMINGINGLGPRDFGPALMRSLLKQLKAEFPNAETIGGHRVSGAREAAGKEMVMPIAEVKLEVPKGWDSIDTANEFRRVLESGQWQQFSPRTRAYIVPDALRSQQDRAIAQAVSAEVSRLIPKKLSQSVVADRIETTSAAGQRLGETIEPAGVYMPNRIAYPIILTSLEGMDPISNVRHEAIHHLRQYGFFNPKEWSVLETAAMQNKWIEEHGISRRYPTADHALKLEESIAEAFTEWMKGRQFEGLTPEVTTLFERLKELFEAIKQHVARIVGKDNPTWEDVFKRVDTGEVGQREGTTPRAREAYNAEVEDAMQAPKAANDIDAKQGQRSTYEGAVRKQQVERFIDENTVRGDFDYWQKIAEAEGHAMREGGLPNAFAAARAASEGGKTSLIIDANGRRVVYQDGVKVARELNRDVENLERLQVEPPADPARVFERANALGMTIDQYKRYSKLIEARHAEDIEATTKRVTDAQRRTQTAEWKANRAALRAQVVDEINLRPDIAADNYFADGILYGEKVERIRLGTDFLTEEQRASLPRDYYVKAGVHPDDLAPLFGFPDGASLVQHLSGLSAVRRQSGMRPIEFKRRMIDIETDRQMRLRYGVLEDNIIDAVKEQVASETQLNLLAEETVYYGVKSGQSPAFDQATIKRIVADEFEASSTTSVSSDRYLAAAGRAGRAVENALLKEDFEAAFREKQRQYYATLLARNAVEFEQRTQKFEKLSARLAKREVKAVEPEYLDFIHELLGEAGVPIKRSMDEISRSKDAYGNSSLGDFVDAKNLEGWDIAVGENLREGPAKPLDQMTVAEAREFMDAVTSLNHVGRAVRKIEIAGDKQDFADFRANVVRNIESLPPRSRASQNNWFYKVDASLTRMEEIAKDLDLRKELGPLHQAVIEPMMRSKAKEFDLMTDLSKHFQETRGEFGKEWRRSLGDSIAQDVLHDPYTQTAYDMTRENLIQVMLNWGNRSNIRKFVQGAAVAKFGRRLDREEFSVYESQIKALIDKHATREDWQFVQRMWEPFKGWQSQMEEVSRNTSGVVPKLIDITDVETPHGTFKGGYWPVKYDRLGSNASVIEDRRPAQEGVFGADYFRAATAKGYLKERTGYVDFVDISTSLEQAAGTMQQTIHDIAFRDSLIQAGRVFYDKGIRAAIRKHYGAEYEAQLVPWLRRIAHQFSTDDSSIAGYNDFMRRVRINLVGHALPLNLKVILSPDVGVPDPKAWASYVANRAENTKLAMEKSDEIRHLVYNMDRDYRESLDRVTLDPTVGDLQKKAVQWGFVPIAKVSQEFRISTFVDQYQKALGRGKTEQEAALIADSYVRERHGAASVVDLPAIMQSNEGMKMLTMFYGFFNTMYNWQRQLPGNVRRGEWKEFGVNGLGSVVVGAAFGAALFNQRKQDDSWWKITGKALLLQPLSTVPIVREASSYAFEGFQPRTPLASLLGAAGSIYTDVKKAAKGQRVEKPITHAANVIGLSTGLPLAQAGRTAQFAADVATRKQKPKNIAEWARGIISGEAKLKK